MPVLIVVKANKGQSEDPGLYRLGVKNPPASMSSRCYPGSNLLPSVVRAEEGAASMNSDSDQWRLNPLLSWRDSKGNCQQVFLCQLPLQLHSGHCTSYPDPLRLPSSHGILSLQKRTQGRTVFAELTEAWMNQKAEQWTPKKRLLKLLWGPGGVARVIEALDQQPAPVW